MVTGRAVVVGAGIGGLAAGIALADAGWQVSVLERGDLAPVGAGISLWPNAIRCLDRLGLGDAVRAAGPALTEGTVRRPDGRVLARTTVPGALAERFGDPVLVLARPTLTDLLVGRLPAGTLQVGRSVDRVTPGSPDAVASVELADGGRLPAELVVAADGIGSRLRPQLFPEHPGPRYAGYTSWRLLTSAADLTGSETWGPDGQRFTVVPMAGARSTATPPRTPRRGTAADEAAELRRRFGGWHPPIPPLLAGLAPARCCGTTSGTSPSAAGVPPRPGRAAR